MRRIFIGDIQGCLAQLDRLLEELRPRSSDRIYCVGDLVNRGPDSLGVLRRVRELRARTVLGNHDIHLLRVACGKATAAFGEARILAAPDAPALLDWLRAQPVLIVEDDVAVVHAGVHPEWSDLAATAGVLNPGVARHVNASPDERISFATKVRYCDAAGRRPHTDDPAPGSGFRPWDEFYRGRRTVVFGHWARRGLVMKPRLRGLDSGCVWGGTLAAWIAEEDRVVQVPGLSPGATARVAHRQ